MPFTQQKCFTALGATGATGFASDRVLGCQPEMVVPLWRSAEPVAPNAVDWVNKSCG